MRQYKSALSGKKCWRISILIRHFLSPILPSRSTKYTFGTKSTIYPQNLLVPNLSGIFWWERKQNGFIYCLTLSMDIDRVQTHFYLRLKNFVFLPIWLYFCLLFPFAPSDICIYASRSQTKNLPQNLLAQFLSGIFWCNRKCRRT